MTTSEASLYELVVEPIDETTCALFVTSRFEFVKFRFTHRFLQT